MTDNTEYSNPFEGLSADDMTVTTVDGDDVGYPSYEEPQADSSDDSSSDAQAETDTQIKEN